MANRTASQAGSPACATELVTPNVTLRLTDSPPPPIDRRLLYTDTEDGSRYYIQILAYPGGTDPASLGGPEEVTDLGGLVIRARQLGRYVPSGTGGWVPARRR